MAARRLLLAVLLAAQAAWPAMAQVALYGVQPPPGSAFVRFVNAAGWAVSVEPDFTPAQTLGVGPVQRVSAYAVVDRVAGRVLTLDARQGDHAVHTTLHVTPGSFVTVIIQSAPGGGLAVMPVVDEADFNQARARLAFYNATAACSAGSLLLEPKGVSVFSDVAAGTAKMRSVNPVTAQLRAACAGQTQADLSLDGMQVGSSYSVWLMLPDGHPIAFVTHDVTQPYKP